MLDFLSICTPSSVAALRQIKPDCEASKRTLYAPLLRERGSRIRYPRRYSFIVRVVVAHGSQNHHTYIQWRSAMKTIYIIGVAAAMLLTTTAISSGTESAPAPQESSSGRVPLYSNLGSHHKSIST